MGGSSRRKRKDEIMYVPDTIQFDPSTDDDGVDDVSELWTSTQFIIKEQNYVAPAAHHEQQHQKQKQQQAEPMQHKQDVLKQKQHRQQQQQQLQPQQILFSHSSMSESRQDDDGEEEEEHGNGAAHYHNHQSFQTNDDDDTDVRVLEDTLRHKQQSVAQLKLELNEMRHSILGVRVVDGVTLFDDDDDDDDDDDEGEEPHVFQKQIVHNDEFEPHRRRSGFGMSKKSGSKKKSSVHRSKTTDKGNKYYIPKKTATKGMNEGPPVTSSFASIRQRVLRHASAPPLLQMNKGSSIVRKRYEQGKLDQSRYINTKRDDSTETEDTSNSSGGDKILYSNEREIKKETHEQDDDGVDDDHNDNEEEEEESKDGRDTEASVARLEKKVAMAQARADSLIFEQERKRQLQKELEQKKAALEKEYESKSKQLEEMYEKKLQDQRDDLRSEFNAEREQHELRLKELEERLQHRTETINILGRSLKKLEEGMADTLEEMEWLSRLKEEQEKIITHLTDQTEELQERNDILANELAHLSEDSALSHEALSGTRSHYEGVSLNLQSQLEEKEAQIESLTNLADRNKLSLQQLRRDMDRMSMTWEERLKTAERKQETLQEEKHKLTQTNMSLKLNVEDLESQLGLCRKQREESNDMLSKRLRDTEQKMIDLQTKLEDVQRTNSELTITLQTKDEEKTNLEEKYEALDTQVRELTHQLGKVNKELKEAQAKSDLMKEEQLTKQRELGAARQTLELKFKTLQEEAKTKEERFQTQLDQLKSKHASEVDGLKLEITYREADTEQYKQTAEKSQGKLQAMTAQYQKLVHAVKRRTAEQDHQRKQMELKLKESTQRADYLQSQIQLLEEQQKQQRRAAGGQTDDDYDSDSDGADGKVDIMSRLSDDDLESILADVEGVMGSLDGSSDDKTMDFVFLGVSS